MIDPERFRSGEGEYFEEVVRKYGPLVLMVTTAFGRDSDHAEDLFQEVWKRTYERRISYGSRGSFEAWLHRLATNVCIGEYRARQARARALEGVGMEGRTKELGWMPPDPLGETERRELPLRLHRALAHLSGREHEAICLRVLEGRTPEEVAQIMGVEKSTVRSHIRHGINRLKTIMEDPGYELPGYQPSH